MIRYVRHMLALTIAALVAVGTYATEVSEVYDPDDPDDLVVIHGDPSLPNMIIGGGGLSGWVDIGRLGVGSRWCDLMIGATTVASNLGPLLVPALFEAYGVDIADTLAVDGYQLLEQFL